LACGWIASSATATDPNGTPAGTVRIASASVARSNPSSRLLHRWLGSFSGGFPALTQAA
jgi:hypothetical protein